MTLSRKIVIGLTAGIGCGVVFGELCGRLEIVGQAFIALMQMTVLPYIVLALIVNIGSLTIETARQIAGRAAAVLLGIWTVAIAVILLLMLGLPEWKTGGFFSDSLTAPREHVDFVSLYIPSNPFYSLAQNIVPGVVLFSICIGVALIGLEKKETLIRPARVLLDAMTKVTHAVARLTPYGVFAIAANAAGTITLSEIDRLQGYMIIYGTATILLSFVVLPLAVAVVTPFSYREVLSASRGPLLTAFAANNYFIVLPMLIENLKELFRRHDIGGDDTDRTIDIALPIGFPFPNTGRLLALIFIPFAAWYVGRPLLALDYPKLVVAGLPSLFAKVTIAVPYLLDLMRLPADLFHLFLLTGILNGHLSSLAGAMHLFAYTAITTAAVTGHLKFARKKAMATTIVTTALIAICIAGTHTYLKWTLDQSQETGQIVRKMGMISAPAQVTMLDRGEPNPEALSPGQSRLDRVQQRGTLRVCYLRDNLPFSYLNQNGELVGLDIEMAHQLANDLGASLELVPISSPENTQQHLDEDHCEIAMSGFAASASHLLSMTLSTGYLDLTPGLVVPDHLRNSLDTLNELLTTPDLRIGVVNDPDIIRIVNHRLPGAQAIPVPRVTDFFGADPGIADVLVISAEAGSAWTLVHPEYHVVVPFRGNVKWPLTYPVASGDPDLLRFVDLWIAIKKSEGFISDLRDHWILGKNAVPRTPRWSVARNVLHWID